LIFPPSIRQNMSHHSARFFTLLALAVVAVRPVSAGALAWRGGSSSEWSDPANWNSTPPANGTAANIDKTGPYQPVVSDSSNFTPGNLTLFGGNLLTFNRTTATDPIVYGYVMSGSGSIALTGSGAVTLSGANTYTGTTTIDAGVLNVTGSLGNTAVTVGPGGTLAFGGATIGGSITTSGLISAGLGTATGSSSLTLQSGSTLQLSLGATNSFGQYAVLGQFTPGGTLQVQLANSFNPALGNSFDILDFGSLGSGTFASLVLPALDSGLGWDTSALYTTGTISVAASAIPEPSTYAAMVGAGALALAALRRRKHCASTPAQCDPCSARERFGVRRCSAAVMLLIEVAHSSLAFDREVKMPQYARAGIVETWLVNLEQQHVEVFREPGPLGYATTRMHRRDAALAPYAFPEALATVGDLLA
jgi:autotransporter-associated beta strand protein